MWRPNTRARLLVCLLGLPLGCTSTDPPPAPAPAEPAAAGGGGLTVGGAAKVGACVSITQRVLRGLVGAASDRGIEDLAGVEKDLAEYLDQRCIAEGWADTIVPAMLACPRGDRACTSKALAPVMAHRRDFDDIIERHRARP